jgi:hypothetical protein
MKSFGYDAPDPRIKRVPAPVGTKCYLCKRDIVEGDRGVILPFSGGPDDPPELSAHLPCFGQAVGVPVPPWPKTTRSN